jgi:hypothetical protein
MMKRILVISMAAILSGAVFAGDAVDGGVTSASSDNLIMANNPRQGRRGNRQENRDEKQDCRQEEGRVGDDKRECKQEDRGEGGDDDKDEAEAEG